MGLSDSVEAPSGKDAAYENFPVGSWLLPPKTRPHVATFYAFARTIDDIADSPHLEPAEKIRRLEGFEAAITGQTDDPAYGKAHAMRRSLRETGVPERHCLDLVSAFKQDAVKSRYASWDELIDYCDRSASPVGRYLLDLHGGSRHGYGPSDALCNGLQVINHLQDVAEDFRDIDRVYVPLDWMADAGVTVDQLGGRRSTPALRRVLDRCVDGIDDLLRRARPLPSGLASRRLAMEASAILDIAETLAVRLRRSDPLAGKIKLGPADYVWACTRGAAAAFV